MCNELFHDCQYCHVRYFCDLDNNACPTINFDADKNMCISCRRQLEDLLNKYEMQDAMRVLRKKRKVVR